MESLKNSRFGALEPSASYAHILYSSVVDVVYVLIPAHTPH